MRFLSTALSASLCVLFVAVAGAAASPFRVRDVWDPPVLYPHAGTVWRAGARHNVTWNVTNPPAQITNGVGLILLRNGSGFTSGVDPLASGFPITLGRIEVQVPHVSPGRHYQVVLFGDSGNNSPDFTISQ